MLNALIAIDKPAGCTSHDVVAKLRRLFGQKRVGHAGTLDPFATGVLVIGLGQATKLLDYLASDSKAYRATFCFGGETSTDDCEGDIVSASPLSPALYAKLSDRAYIRAWQETLLGQKSQVPPAVSAVSVDGERSYKRARTQKKEAVEKSLSPKEIRIYKAHITPAEQQEGTALPSDVCEARNFCWNVEVEVSKGTYIRSLARDMGRKMGCGAYVSALQRVRSGNVQLLDACTLDELEACLAHASKEACLKRFSLNPYALLDMPFRFLSPSDLRKAQTGASLLNTVSSYKGKEIQPKPASLVALYNDEGLWGIWRAKNALALVCEKNFAEPICGLEVPYGF